MNKIFLVIKREYLTRVSKKSFWIASLVAPLLLTAIYAVPIWLATRDKEVKQVAIWDGSGLFEQKDLADKEIAFQLVKGDVANIKKTFDKQGYSAFAAIPADILTNPQSLKIYSEKNLSLSLKNDIERMVQNKVREILLRNAGISTLKYKETQVDISSDTITVSKQGAETTSSSGGAMILAAILGFLLYLSLLLYGSQVMNGVIEEKSSRIIEVIISSIKPYQLMLGKILGVGMVGLTQFLLWIVLTIGLSTATSKLYQAPSRMATVANSSNSDELKKSVAKVESSSQPMDELNKVIESTNIPLILGSFFFYFLFGYLLYSSLFAAIGSAVESAAEAQQFTFPVMIPIILAFILAQFTMQDPDSSIAFWASIIPFTSPINMMVRLPYGVPTWEIILSMVLLVGGFLACSWLSSRIYRVGILMYGKKMTWKEISKWVFYKN
ncbi:ABC transporter permease [Aquirufa ecclesiirivi]|uniref:ABC transporter permease n=1 Tax=Aquirufa ecclesiirivi TaxID=2715124 RepID=A0ABT4JC03_9BACT|nr:ABC transporter permease [Aquirufa ecclesiirivi]MCZ2472494.1 ABC transporter permease [Aquirufa ecclesiirivi]MCZ2473826.1 ABC transporter permease [Aquirufa ecclesiirivi]MDF0694742.1 ABC transporter permease [Aquirufa ecclesiirivi]